MNPDFHSRAFLLNHIRHTMSFYHPRAIDASGGFYHYFRTDGSVSDAISRHLVSSTRIVFTYAMAYRNFRDAEYLEGVRHGVRFLREVHRNPETGGYAWTLRYTSGRAEIEDATNHCYGLIFVLFAYAHALKAGMPEAASYLEETCALLDKYFWLPEFGLFADERSPDWNVLDPYRGQNANMHACEAYLAAFDATDDMRYLKRASLIATNMLVRQTKTTEGLVWEHYREDWSVDWEYNRNDRTNIFRPWGYQPGHFTQWSKLLLILERHKDLLSEELGWIPAQAQHLFRTATESAWDADFGGFYYGFAPDGTICDDQKHFWVQAESLAAAALLGARTGDSRYWNWYDRIWEYCWTHFVDHKYGAWFRILTRENQPNSDIKSPASKVDYHTMGACYDILQVIDRP